ncbi:MAG TPA: hypothetical protein PK230_02815, partial [Chitinophagales bacterium]|nr:hypothetical protein [Chitinophagales bacterium]
MSEINTPEEIKNKIKVLRFKHTKAPRDMAVCNELAFLSYLVGDGKSAEKYWRKILELGNDDPYVHAN